MHAVGYLSCMVLYVHRKNKTYWGRANGGGGRGRSYTYHYTCHLQNDSCIKTGSDESPFNVSLIVRDKVTRQCPQKRKGGPEENQVKVQGF